ncbi:MAG: hypothetical protein COB93_10330 [Sneathiella sp.]|nr:MAG: hypothetical protein COB93_10330 [Sneathiella sp.]
MSRFISAAAGAIVAVIGFSSAAFSYEESRFLGIDSNADNMISADEVDAYRTRLFSAYDLNGDGKVEYEEYVQAENLRPSTATANSDVPIPDEYREMDTDGDTVVTLEEIKAAGALRLKALDKDRDGLISKDEFVSPGL